MTNRRAQYLQMAASPALCVALLAAIVAEARTRIQPKDADPFHRAAAAAIDSIPSHMDVAVWTSEDIPIPTPAAKLLHLNASLSTRYYERVADGGTDGGIQGDVLIIQCRDAVDMQGHYPPHCYPANGGKQLEPGNARTWTVGGTQISGMEYLFSMPNGPTDRRVWVYDFFVIPRIPGLKDSMEGIYPDIEAVYKSGGSYQRHYFGAAQFEFVFDAATMNKQADRDRFLNDFMTPNMSVIQTLLNEDHLAAPSPPQPSGASALDGELNLEGSVHG